MELLFRSYGARGLERLGKNKEVMAKVGKSEGSGDGVKMVNLCIDVDKDVGCLTCLLDVLDAESRPTNSNELNLG